MSKFDFLLVSGAGIENVNGIYALSDNTVTGYNRIWLKSDPVYFIFAKEINGVMTWCVHNNIKPNGTPLYTFIAENDNPLTADGSFIAGSGTAPGPKVSEFDSNYVTLIDAIEDAQISMLNLKHEFKSQLEKKQVTVGDVPFYKYPDLIRNIITGGAAEYFKCVAVGTTGSGSSGTSNSSVIVSGAGSGHINGTYTLTDIVIDKDYLSEGQKKVYSYYWADLDQTLYIYYDWNSETWWISDDYNNHDIPFYGSSNAGSENPWEGGEWNTGDAADPAPTVTLASGGTSGSTSASTDIIVSGFDDDSFNGTYTLEDASATGIYRVWVKGDIRIQTDQDTEANTAVWRFLTPEWNNEDNSSVAYSHVPYENPWDATEWLLYTDYHGITGEPVVKQAGGSSGSPSMGETVVVVSGCPKEGFNGTYRQGEILGYPRAWVMDDDIYYMVYEAGTWYMFDNDGSQYYANVDNSGEPWDCTYWQDYHSSAHVESIVVTQQTEGGSSETPALPANTWSGYKAVLTTDTETGKQYYDFEENLTEGLTFGNGFTPVVGKVYDSEAMVEAKLKHASIEKTAIFTEAFNGSISDKLTVLNEAPQFTNIAGKSCMLVDHAHRLSMPCSNFPMGNAARSIAANLYFNTFDDYSFYVGYGGDDSNTFNICTFYDGVKNYHRGSEDVFGDIVTAKWYHIVMTFDGTTMKCYINGLLSGQYNYTYNTNITDYPLYVGYLATQNDNYFNQNGYIANLSVYDRALTEEEIQQLYQEFKT